ncbi:DUF1467 family protein [Marinibacterium profundimaris]|uniref:Uncharacterized protein n=1 Tax=Marinibacterium profundimaris TaxID=1679460 RepID=A0A225NF37_9RHOB|nr:DUF1467 family protein [Marinibacterium profundimaris]OWU67860.1 hypothetical protein ATO3_25260 [Marinibacterium profundimaris]
MSITAGLVLFVVIWFLTFFVVLPLRLQTQGEAGEVVPGTHSGAPENHNLKKKAVITTVAAAVIWAIIATIIITGMIEVRDFDWFHRMPPASE